MNVAVLSTNSDQGAAVDVGVIVAAGGLVGGSPWDPYVPVGIAKGLNSGGLPNEVKDPNCAVCTLAHGANVRGDTYGTEGASCGVSG